MTEVPEHLLERSRARRAALGLGGGDAPEAGTEAAPATAVQPAAAAAAPVPAAAAAPAVPVEAAPPPPPPPWVQAAQERRKIPFWAVPVLAFLPVWAPLYALTLDPPTVENDPLTLGAEVYSGSCAACHGGSGGGQGAAPALADGAVLETFPNPADHLHWVLVGSDGWESDTYGAQNKPKVGNMPGWASLETSELMAVVRHERETQSDEELDLETWVDVVEMLEEVDPARATEAEEVLAEWEAAG